MKGMVQRLILFFFIFITCIVQLSAQKNRFIYIQTENKQTFYVKVYKKLFSSSATGYLIIPKLKEGIYQLFISYPGNEWPLQSVTCVVKESDVGYLLKNFDDKTCGLLNLQTMQLQMAEKQAGNGNDSISENTGDAFSTILASVVNDPGMLKKQKKPDDGLVTVASPEIRSNENAVINKEPVVVPDQTNEKNATIKDKILKIKHDSTANGIVIVFQDIENGVTDTVGVYIQIPEVGIIEKQVVQVVDTLMDQPREKATVKDSKFIDMELPNPNQTKDTGVNKLKTGIITERKFLIMDTAVVQQNRTDKSIRKVPAFENVACRNIAAYDDFLKLRKLMAAELNDTNMITAALKKFKSVCFTTEQIKNLGVLFVNEEGRYKFYVAAYPYVSDLSNFSSLEEQLRENYFITRFKAMLHR